MRRRPFALAVVVAVFPVSSVSAQERAVRNPPEATIRRTPPSIASDPKIATVDKPAADVQAPASLTLKVMFVDTTLRNPGTQQLDRVRLRAYQSEKSAPDAPLVAPTIRVTPGETVRLTLDNQLPVEPGCEKTHHNTPHCFNSTNIHTHGLWVSPENNGDNVFVTIRPEDKPFEYEYRIPVEHPAGTFWYHPHLHGSTALQVGSGMAGAMIVEGRRLPSAGRTGDIDTLLKYDDGTAFVDRILVLQQIPYACRDATGAIKRNSSNQWRCDPNDVGSIEKYDDQLTPPSSWRLSGRFTTINGRTMEALQQRATVGRIERWRFIHGGVRATVRVQFRKKLPNAAPFSNVPADQQADWIKGSCDAQVVPHWQMAADGLTQARLSRRESTYLQPGYRGDLLVAFPSAGEYCVIDEEVADAQSVNGVNTSRQLLTVVTVDGTGTIADLDAHLTAQLKAAAARFMPPAVRDAVIADLDAGLGVRSFVPHPDLSGVKPSGTQTLFFSIANFGVGTNAADARPYDPARMDRTLLLGAIDDWVLSPPTGGVHPFHIHVNPFQIQTITDAKGADLTQVPTSQYWGLQGVWKDTLAIESNVTASVRTEYRRFTGRFVLHCHILDHEDRGMMQNLEIVAPPSPVKPPGPL